MNFKNLRNYLIILFALTHVYGFAYGLPMFILNSKVVSDENNMVIIMGRIIDDENKAISSASVSVFLIEAKDVKSPISTTVTDNNGNFYIELKDLSNDLVVEVSALGMQKYTLSLSTKIRKRFELPEIMLVRLVERLEEVSVTSSKPTIELKNDRLIYNVGNSITAVGNDALQLLRRAPGVTVSSTDQIALKGNSGVQIMINGRLSYLSGGDLSNYLKSIPSSQIEAIEIITNPSARFDASGTAGIINIRLKKNQKLGFTGAVNLNGVQGFTPKFNGSVESNYRAEKFNVYGTYSYEDGTYKTKGSILREQILNGSPIYFDQNSTDKDYNQAHSFKVGADFFIDDKNTIGVFWNGSNRHNNDLITGSTAIFKEKGKIDSILSATNDRSIKSNNNSFNVNYQYLDTSGRELIANFNYIHLNRRENSYQPNSYTDNNGNRNRPPIIYSIDAPTNLSIYVGNIDYKQKLFGGNVEIGAKISDVQTNNDFNNYQYIDEKYVIDPELTNFFTYDEKIAAGYFNYNISLGKLVYQAGLRVENTSSLGNLKTLNDQDHNRVKRNYLDFFPSASVLYKKDDNNSFSVNYSRRIQRPNYQNLNPFEIRKDELTFFQGNPFLKPEYSNKIEASYSFKQYIITSIEYMNTTNVVSPVTIDAQDNRILGSYQNIGENDNYTLSVSSNIDITKWLSFYINTNLYYQQYNGQLERGVIKNSGTTLSFSGQSTFKMAPTVVGEISYFYRTAEVYGILKNSSAGQIDIGLKKTLFNDRASIRLACSDVFHMLKLTSKSIYDGINIVQHYKPESRVVTLGFSYRFGGKNVEKTRQRSAGSESESRRL